MASWNPFDWVDNGLDAAGEAWDAVTDTFSNLVRSGGETIFGEGPTQRIIRESTEAVTTPTLKAAKVGTRAATTAYDFPLQVLNNSAAFAYNNPAIRSAITGQKVTKGKGVAEAEASTIEQLTGIIRNTTLAQVIADSLPGGRKLDVGSGFFVGGDTNAEINRQKQELYPTIYGSTFTVGRAFAYELADNGIIEPGSTAYNVISGGLDAVWTIGADPTNWIPVGAVAKIGEFVVPITAAARAGKRAKVTTTLSAKAEKIIKEAAESGKIVLDSAGLIDNGRRTVNPNNWEAFKLTRKGQRWVESFVGDASGTAAEIWRKSNGQIPPLSALRLEEAKTFDEVISVFDDAVYGPDPLSHIRIMPGIDPRPIVTQVGATIKGNMSRYRPFADTLPESTDFPLNNPLKAVKNADSVMAVLEVENATRNELLNELFRAFAGTDNKKIFDWLGKFEKTVVASQLKRFNFADSEIERIASWRKRWEESISSFVTDSAGSSVPLEWLVGGSRGGYGPLLISQMLRVNPILIDPEDMRYIADNIGPIRSRLEASRRRIVETDIDPFTGEKIIEATEPRWIVEAPLRLKEGVENLVEWSMTRVWKANILVRPRYLIRVLPEEMLRVSASGIFDHPFQYIAQLFTNSSSIDAYGKMITTSRRAARVEAELVELGRQIRTYDSLISAGQTKYRGKNLNDLRDRATKDVDRLNTILKTFDDRMADLLPGMDDALLRGQPRRASDLMMNPAAVSGMVKRGNLISVERKVQPKLWSKAMAQRLAERASNSYYRSIAESLVLGENADTITRRFLDDTDLKPFLDQYRKEVGNLDPNYVWDYNGTKNFVQKNIDDIDIYTMNRDPELLRALATNEFRQNALSHRSGYQRLAWAAQNQKVAKFDENKVLTKYYLDNFAQDPNAPARVNYFPSIYDEDKTMKGVVGRVTKTYDDLLRLWWDGVYGASSDKLARNPLWSQAKWQRIVELVPVMSKAEAERLVANIEKTNLFSSIKEDIREFAKTATGEMTIKDVEMLAELHATKTTREMLFDASRRTKFGADHRLLFPFFDAFVEITGSALKLATNPKVLHRADKVITELRNNTFFGSDIDGDGKKDGFLYRDPVSGEEMYSVSVDGLLGKNWRKLGLDFRFANTLDSLSMITTLYPGLSPYAAFPLAKLLPDTADFDKLRDLIAPYGLPDPSDPSFAQFFTAGASEQIQRILGASGIEVFSKVEDRQKQAQAVIRAMQVLATVKDYDPATPGQQGPTGYRSLEQWQADARELGTKIYGLTGWAGLFMPGAPIAQWSARTKKGNVLISVLSQRWNQIDKKGDELDLTYDDKLQQFVEEFGPENLVAFLQPITNRSITGSNSSKEYFDWYRSNQQVVDKYPDVGGYFSPLSGELDPDVWNIQKIAGDVEYKDPKEFAKKVESAVANFVFNRNLRQFEESIPPNERGTASADEALKAERNRLSDGLSKAYPNWDRAMAYTQSQNQRDLQFLQIRQFVEEPSQQDNPVVIAAKKYLAIRDENVQYLVDREAVTEKNWKSATANPAALALRSGLWEAGEKLAEQYPAFVNLWQNVLSREFRSVEIEE